VQRFGISGMGTAAPGSVTFCSTPAEATGVGGPTPPPGAPTLHGLGRCRGLLLADSRTFVCRTWDDLAGRLVWARQQGYRTAKARRANRYVDQPLADLAGLTECEPRRFLHKPRLLRTRQADGGRRWFANFSVEGLRPSPPSGGNRETVLDTRSRTMV
jgi:hypothetical protein